MSVDDLNRRIYDRNNKMETFRRSRLSVARDEGPTSWEQKAPEAPSRRRFSLPVKILLGSVVIFIIVMLSALAILFGNVSTVSDTDISLLIEGPSSIKAGDEVPVTVSITNKNRVPLESAELAIVYPDGTKDLSGNPLSRERRPLGLILPGSTKNLVFKSILYGPESSEPDIKITLEYHLSGSNALFQKESEFKTLVGSPSINLSTTLPNDITSNQPLQISVKISSNDRQTLKNVLLKADYPPGFSYQSSNPLPYVGNQTWLIGDLTPGSEKTVVIKGVLEGQDQEVKSFNFTAGEATGKDNESIGARYAALFRTVTINRPFIATRLSINNKDSSEYIARAGEQIKVDIDWLNNLPTTIQNAEFKVYLSGGSFDRLSVNAGRGFYQSADNTIVWTKTNNSDFKLMEPGALGRVSFSFNMLGPDKLASDGQALTLKLVVNGLRVDSDVSEQQISTELEKTIKVGSSLQLATRGVYYVGPFANHGPLPPKAGQETTYTIIWSVVNPSNLVRSGVARAKLSDSVSWGNIVLPASENLSYDPDTNEVIWRLGDIAAGTGSNSPAREVSFQVKFTPSLSQVGQTPNLIEQTLFSGYDTFANVPVDRALEVLNTRLTTDPSWKSGLEKVTQ